MTGIPGRASIPDEEEVADMLPPAVLVEALLYGAHLVLYCLCALILLKRRKTSQLVILFAVTIMFALTTTDVAISFRMLLHDIPKVVKHEMDLLTAVKRASYKTPLFITNNFLADGFLVYRCYMIWSKRKYILIGSVILLVADTVLGYVNANGSIFIFSKITTPLFLWTTLAINIVMTCATAGRIWWITRTVRPFLTKQAARRRFIAMTVLIESGAIYSASLMLFLITPPRQYSLLLEIIPIRLVGIVPILIIVQVELGRGANFEEFERHPQSPSRAGTSRLESLKKKLGALEVSTTSPKTLRTEIQLTTVTERYQGFVDAAPSSQVFIEPPPNAQQTSQRYHW